MLTVRDFREIRRWMYRNARPLDLALWQYHLENGDPETVIQIMTVYQNRDGGFGYALEADNWNPASSPVTTSTAIQILREIGFMDPVHPMVREIIRYLDGCPCGPEGWPFTLPSNNDAPHAPWWTYSEEANAVESMGVTAELAAFLLKMADKDTEIYSRALALARVVLDRLQKPGLYGDMGLWGANVLLESIPDSGLAGQFDMDGLTQTLISRVNDAIERDSQKWDHYSVRPSNYIRSPKSIFYPGNEEIMEKELEYLAGIRQPGGVWPIPWSWFENTAKYPKEFSISENWWKATKALEKVRLLKSFGRLESPV